MKFTNDLGSDNIKGLVWTLAVPSMLSQLVSVLYSIVDRMYIGNIPSNGTQALAGVGVCGPIVTLISSFAFLVGIGGAPLVSINLGEKNIDAAKKVIANCFVYILALAVPVTVLAYIFRRPILLTFGATEAVYPYAETYFSLYLIGTVFALTATGMNQFIITQGHSRSGMFSVLIGAIINIVLDPIFIFALHMGVAGAAIATVISQVASCAFVLCVLFGKHIEVPITFGGYDLKVIGRVTSIGMSAFLIILFDNVMLISLNMMLQRYGGDNSDMLLTCNTIVQSFELLITMPLGGLTMGTQTILGYNLGARRPEKILRAQRYIFVIAVSFCALMTLGRADHPASLCRHFHQRTRIHCHDGAAHPYLHARHRVAWHAVRDRGRLYGHGRCQNRAAAFGLSQVRLLCVHFHPAALPAYRADLLLRAHLGYFPAARLHFSLRTHHQTRY